MIALIFVQWDVKMNMKNTNKKESRQIKEHMLHIRNIKF